MARIIRLTESDLARIVRRVINENPIVGTSTIEVKRGSITLVTNGVKTIKRDHAPTQVQPDTKIINASSDVLVRLRDGEYYTLLVDRSYCPKTGAELKTLAKKYNGKHMVKHSNVPKPVVANNSVQR